MPDSASVSPTSDAQLLSEDLFEKAIRQVVWCNSSFAEKFGYTRDEALGEVMLSKLLGPNDDHIDVEKLAKARASGEKGVDEYLGFTKDGHTRWVEVYSQPLTDDDGKPTGYTLAIDRDITAMKLGEALGRARRTALARLGEGAEGDVILAALISGIEGVFPDMRISILLLDAEGKRFRTVVGPSLPRVYNQSLQGVEIGPMVGSCGTAAYLGERVITRDIYEDPKWAPYLGLAELSGMRSCWSEPVRAVSGKVIGTLAIYYSSARLPSLEELDFIRQAAELASTVIERKRLEDALEAARRRAEDASYAKSRFLANMSHELRTPLNAVIGFSELITAGVFQQDVEKYDDFASEIGRSARTLLALISTLLDSANLQQGTYQLEERIVDLKVVIDVCLKAVEQQAQRHGVAIKLDWPENMPALFADPAATEKVLTKILDNALKFSPEGSEVHISGQMASNGDLVVCIRDSGEGIPSEDVNRVLEPFEQGGDASAYLARKYGGTGLGLAICHSIMQLHGGDVELRSEPGHGTWARIVFPASRVILSRAFIGGQQANDAEGEDVNALGAEL